MMWPQFCFRCTQPPLTKVLFLNACKLELYMLGGFVTNFVSASGFVARCVPVKGRVLLCRLY